MPTASHLSLPFERLDVWSGLHLQIKDYHDPGKVHPPQTQCAWPPSQLWPLGHYDTVLININPDKEWPYSKMLGNYHSWTIFNLLTSDFPRALHCSDLAGLPCCIPYRFGGTSKFTPEFIPCLCSML
jgi:hypothetical protein